MKLQPSPIVPVVWSSVKTRGAAALIP